MPFPVDEREIEAAEQALRRRFPAAMRNRLSLSNGGEIEVAGDDCGWFLYPVRDATTRKRLSRTCNDIVRETRLAREWARFPNGAVAIADNGCGDHLVLLPGSDDIHFWDHESGELSAETIDWG